MAWPERLLHNAVGSVLLDCSHEAGSANALGRGVAQDPPPRAGGCPPQMFRGGAKGNSPTGASAPAPKGSLNSARPLQG
eukprot:9163510-Alexandrium_andersonii.AAC.1